MKAAADHSLFSLRGMQTCREQLKDSKTKLDIPDVPMSSAANHTGSCFPTTEDIDGMQQRACHSRSLALSQR